MKSLTLYVDKWYIIGAVCTDGVPRLIQLPNREDRFWLYFYEDTANNNLVYGKDNQLHFRNKENHYYGDVFSLITEPRESFSIYGRQREFKDIFEVSGILETIKKQIDETTNIETYVSFSQDINDNARKIFIDILEENNFKVQESVARIGHLACEYGHRHGYFKQDGNYLILNACNENLHYALYNKSSDYFTRIKEDVLGGYGTDLRSRALLETIVENLNNRLHFLSSTAEKEEEYVRLQLFVHDWLLRLANAKNNIPFTIPKVSFSNSANSYSITIVKRTIDERTSVIVSDIVRVITEFVKQSNVKLEEVKGVLLLGNTFTNSQFEQALKDNFAIQTEDFVKYKESELPNIVGVYSIMDCSQFSEASDQFLQNAEAEALRQKNARDEEERKQRAIKEQEEALRADQEAREAEQKYKTYMEAADACFREQDYIGMQDNLRDALIVRPDDAEATQKLQEAIRLAAEEAATAKQYNSIIQRAKRNLDEKLWSEAKAQAENALNLKPQSKEAQRIYEEAKNQLNIENRIKEYLTRADLFVAQKSYDEAITELKKAINLDANNDSANERLNELEAQRNQTISKINSLKQQLDTAEHNKDYTSAIAICEQLIEIDFTNIRKWSEKTQQIKERIKALEEKQVTLKKLKLEIDTLLFDENWNKIVQLCEQYLQLEESDDIRQKRNRAQQKIDDEFKKKQEEEKNREFNSKVSEIKALITDGNLQQAEKNIRALQQEYPNEKEILKDLRSRLFNAEEINNASTKGAQRPKPIGFSASDDFFGNTTPSPSQPKKPTKPVSSPSKPTHKTGFDFFDMDIPKKNNNNTNPSRTNNNDFNF